MRNCSGHHRPGPALMRERTDAGRGCAGGITRVFGTRKLKDAAQWRMCCRVQGLDFRRKRVLRVGKTRGVMHHLCRLLYGKCIVEAGRQVPYDVHIAGV